jgi:hypothetical protein
MTRRSALAVAGLLVLGGLAQAFRWPRVISTADVARRVAALFGDLSGARTLGSQYLKAHTEEADLAILLDLLGAESDAIEPEALRRKIAQRLAGDFLAGRIVHVDGWVLARTEARACAIAALT